MATQGTNEGRSNDRPRGAKDGEKKRVSEYHAPSSRGNGEGRKSSFQKSNGEGGNRSEYRKNNDGNRERRGNGEYRQRGEGRANGEGRENREFRGERRSEGRPNNNGERRSGNGGGFRSNGGGSYRQDSFRYQKDKDEDDGRRPPTRSSRPKEPKVKEQQPDKFETIKRLEREQKTIKKKEQSKRKGESSRPQQKQKRSNNQNFTKMYENGDFDDYFYDDF